MCVILNTHGTSNPAHESQRFIQYADLERFPQCALKCLNINSVGVMPGCFTAAVKGKWKMISP